MSENTKRERSQKSFPGQQAGENVVVVQRQFPVVLRKPLLLGLVIVLVAMLPWAFATYNDYSWAGYTGWWLAAWFIVLGFIWLRAWVAWFYSVYVLTTQRIMVVHQRGFFGREVNELTLNNVQNANYAISGFTAALFGFGTVTIETLSGGQPLKLKLVTHPADLQQAIVEAARRYGLKKKPS